MIHKMEIFLLKNDLVLVLLSFYLMHKEFGEADCPIFCKTEKNKNSPIEEEQQLMESHLC